MRNLKFSKQDNTAIDLIFPHQKYGDIPYTASPNDTESAEIFARALAGEFGPIAPYVAPVTPQATLDAIANAAANKELQRLRLEAVDDLITWAAGQATGQDRAAMQQRIAALNVEKTKIRP